MHYPKNFRSATAGSNSWCTEKLDFQFEQFGHLPACLDYVPSESVPPTEVNGDIYLLDDSGSVFTITSIAWQSGNTVRYTFSGSPNLSSYSAANNVIRVYGTGITNSEHIGRFTADTINDGSDYVEVTNPLVSDNSLDETGLSNASAQLPRTELIQSG
jgi:hypothetical protein